MQNIECTLIRNCNDKNNGCALITQGQRQVITQGQLLTRLL